MIKRARSNSEILDFSVQINPFTAMAVGFLGLPGAALVVLLQLLL